MGVSVLIFSLLNFRLYPDWFKNWMMSFMSFTVLSDWKNFFVVISSGAFTSSMVTLLISVSEYRVEKRTALENFADANIHFCASFYNLKYLNINIPMELLQGYYAEQRSFPRIYNPDEQSSISENETKIKAWIWNNAREDIKEQFSTDEDKKEYLDNDFKRIIQKYDEEIKDVMKQYITLSDKINKRELNSAIGKIDFLFGNKYRKEVLHERMYARNSETISKLKNATYYFKDYYNTTNGDKSIILDFIQQIQNYLFSVEEKDRYRTVYNQYLFEMNCEIDNLLRRLYGKRKYHEKPPKIQDFIVVSYWRGPSKDLDNKQDCQEKTETIYEGDSYD